MPPIVTNVSASQNTAWTSFRETTTMIDPPISRTERTRNAASCQSTANARPPSPDAPENRTEGREAGGNQDGEEGERDQALPADVQDLIDAHAGHGPGDPDEHEVKEVDLDEEPGLVRDDRNGDDGASDGWSERDEDGPGPPAKVQDDDERGTGQRPQPFESKDESEPHSRVFREPALHELRFRLGNVERDSLHLRHHRRGEHREADELRDREDVPARYGDGPDHRQRQFLLVDDVDHVQAPRVHEDRDDREEQGNLVGHELGGGPHPPDQRVLVVRRPSGDQNA